MGRLLKRLPEIKWTNLQDSSGSAQGIPRLLATVAWGDEVPASEAIDELGDRVCALGFVVSEATQHVVPFLLELVGDDTVRRRADILALISKIYAARQWEAAASAASPKSVQNYREKISWEIASRQAILAGREVISGLEGNSDPAVSRMACDLLSLLR